MLCRICYQAKFADYRPRGQFLKVQSKRGLVPLGQLFELGLLRLTSIKSCIIAELCELLFGKMEQTRCQEVQHSPAERFHHLVPTQGVVVGLFRELRKVSAKILCCWPGDGMFVVLLVNLISPII